MNVIGPRKDTDTGEPHRKPIFRGGAESAENKDFSFLRPLRLCERSGFIFSRESQPRMNGSRRR